jgi:hypothetical protein
MPFICLRGFYLVVRWRFDVEVIDTMIEALIFERSPVTSDLEDVFFHLDEGHVCDALRGEGEVEL